eukprot:GHVR01060796.1.p2 GENE.GHVR01060796.1~~GHVR01060796.1.p2  ORF type:complete len:122 (-),score=9.31 GHVR01060796.1:337-702(-)
MMSAGIKFPLRRDCKSIKEFLILFKAWCMVALSKEDKADNDSIAYLILSCEGEPSLLEKVKRLSESDKVENLVAGKLAKTLELLETDLLDTSRSRVNVCVRLKISCVVASSLDYVKKCLRV